MRVLIVILVVVVTNENKVNPKFCLLLLLGFDKRLNDGNNNGQAMHGARKPPGPKTSVAKRRAKVGNNNGQLPIATPPRMAHAKPPGAKYYPGPYLAYK